jgi:ABC-type transporter Mla MlaB component
MLRISEMSQSGAGTALRLEGELMGPWVIEVKKACEPFLGDGHLLTLDLADVSLADRTGIALLRELKHAQVRLENCSPFLAEQLKTES